MSGRSSRLASFFVAPATPAPAFVPPAAPPPARPGEPPSRQRTPALTRRRRAAGPEVPAVGVVGDRGTAPFAVDLSCALAGHGSRRCAVTAVWGTPSPAPPRGHPTRSAAQLVVKLASACPGLEAVAGGRGVVVGLPSDAQAAVVAYAALLAAVGDEAVVVLALCGPRPVAFDAVLARQEVIVLALGTGAPAGLSALAEGSLADLAPGARLTIVTPPAGNGLPRPLRHRAAVRHVLETTA
jgi:hypothetical protein